MLLYIYYFQIGHPFGGCVGCRSLDHDDSEGSRDTTVEDDHLPRYVDYFVLGY